MTAKACRKCSEDFKAGDSVLNALGNAYHAQCFVCATCGNPFASGSFVMDGAGNPCHEKCSSVKAVDPDADLGDCPACSKPLNSAEPVVSVGQGTSKEKYHQRCFVCGKCRKPFHGTSYFVENGKPCHTDCIGSGAKDVAQTAVSTLQDDKTCHGCGKAIKGDSSRRFVDGIGHFHPNCFKCSSCEASIDGKFFVHPTTERPICKACGENL